MNYIQFTVLSTLHKSITLLRRVYSDFGLRTSDFRLRRGVIFLFCSSILSVSMFAQGNNVAPDNNAIGANVAIGSRGISGFPLKPLHILTAAQLLNGDPAIRLAFGNGTTNPTNESFFGHLSLLTSANTNQQGYDYSFCKGWGTGNGISNAASAKDLLLCNGKFSEDLILTTFSKDGHIRFSTTPSDIANEWGQLTDLERMTITPNGKVGVATRFPLGRFDINVGDWNYNLPKVSFTGNGNNPQMRLYRMTGYYERSPGVLMADDRFESHSWYIEGAETPGGEFGTLDFRAGFTPVVGGLRYRNEIGTELPITRMTLVSNGNVGINQTQPTAKLQVTDGSVLYNGNTGTTPTNWNGSQLGAGTRLMWIPEKAAFRAGYIRNPQNGRPATNLLSDYSQIWNSANIGNGSAAFGVNCQSKAFASFTAGLGCLVLGTTDDTDNDPIPPGHASIAMGHNSMVSSEDCIALGFDNRIESPYSVTIGNNNRVEGTSNNIFHIGSSNTSYRRSFIFGSLNKCLYNSGGSFALGTDITIGETSSSIDNDPNMMFIGSNLRYSLVNNQSHYQTIMIGRGYSTTYPMNARHNSSIYLGMDARTPLVYIGPNDVDPNGTETYGSVGIATTSPDQARLRINTTPSPIFNTNPQAYITGVVIGRHDWQTGGNPTVPEQNCDLAVQRRVGIGTASPQEALSVVGTGDNNQVVIWSTDQAAPSGKDVDLMVEKRVLIGKTTLLVDNSNSDNYLLHVNGGAIKPGGGSWVAESDARYKKDVVPFSDGLKKLRKVNPVWYSYNGKMGLPTNERYVGVIAQDIQQILPYTVNEATISQTVVSKPEKRYQVDAVDTTIIQVPDYSVPNDEHGHHKYKDSIITTPTKRWVIEPAESTTETAPILTYDGSALTYLLVNSLKEVDSTLNSKALQTDGQIEQLNSTIDSLKLIISNQESRIIRLEAQNSINRDEVSDVILEQNNPNPYSTTTTITYYIPSAVQGNPQLVVNRSSGSQILLSFDVVKGIPTQQIIDATTLDTGVYTYTLIVQGKVLASKKMIVIK